MLRTAAISLLAVLVLAGPKLAAATEKVALRATNGRFLRATDDGAIRAEAFYPSDRETFELVSSGDKTNKVITLRGPGGRYLTPDPRDGRTPRLGAAGMQPGERETFQLVPVGPTRFSLRSRSSRALLTFVPVKAQSDPKAAADPASRETIEIYRIRELPAILETALPAVIHTLAEEELAGKQYDKTQTHETEKFLNLPAPTLKDPKRKKRVQVLGITEEYRVQAELDGAADIHLPGMSFLANYADGGPGLILLAVRAGLPLRGRVEGKLGDAVEGSTGYHLTVALSAVAEVVAEHKGNEVKFGPPAVTDLNISVSRLDLSNDLLEAVRRQIRRVINRELEHNKGRIRESANKALQKAMASRQVSIPLLGYLRLF
jgi:hypothetical protein